MATAANLTDDEQAGRDSADRLANDWDNRGWVPASPSISWARAAVVRFGEIMAEQRSIFRVSMKRADRGASTLSPRPFQGILECLQNADDLAAKSLRVAYRDEGRPELLIVHDGECVTFANVGAMLLPWLSTKEEDADAAGRFGIGQRTLNALGGPIALHASPFHLVMSADGPQPCEPEPDIPGIYDGVRRDTMLVIPLSSKVTSQRIADAVSELSAESLIFLKSIRELRYDDLGDPDRGLRFAVDVRHVDTGSISFSGTTVDVTIDDVSVIEGGRDERPIFRRYNTQRPVPVGEERANKDTGATTPLGVCVPLGGGTPRGLYDRMPLPSATGLSIGLNAQFDPDAARSTLIPNDWNLARMKDLGQLVSWAALNAFARDMQTGWNHVPIASEAGTNGGWMDETIREHVVEASRTLLQSNLTLQIGDEEVDLDDLACEAPELEAILTERDVAALAADSVALPRSARDPAGRWRQVINELGGPEKIDVSDALEIIDGDTARGVEWYVEFAAVFEREHLIAQFLAKPGIMLADGTTTIGPSPNEPWVLVKEASPTALAPRLGIARRIHPAYLDPGAPTAPFVATLEKAGLLFDNRDEPADVFAIIGRRSWGQQNTPPIRLADADLTALRDGWSNLSRERRLELGPLMGRSVAIRSTWIDSAGTRQRGWDRPADLYLPVAIDREVDSFAKAADRTPGLKWADGEYAKLLKQASGRAGIGAQKLFSAWGVSREPRLVRPLDEVAPYARDRTLASPVDTAMRTADHMLAIRSAGNYTHLIDDHWSPDADAVAADIARAPLKSRRKRALALLAVLSRGWDKRYADLATAHPAWAYNGFWNRGNEVRATWLARLADVRWMPDAGNGYQRPCDLQLQTPGSPPRPADRSTTIAKLDPQILRSGVLTALGVKAGPSQRDLIDRLRALRSVPMTPAVAEEVLAAYQLLAATLRDRSDAGPDERMHPAKLRNAFRASPNEAGLLLVDGAWLSPESARRGPPVLGKRRPFAPHVEGLDPLWKALGIQLPSPADAIAVLKEIAGGEPSKADQGVAIRALTLIAEAIDTMTPQLRSTLRRLPLWTGRGWTTARPLYALEGEALLQSAPSELPVWRPGITSFSSMAALLEPLGVVRLTPADFRAASLPAYGVAEGDALRPTFARAVALLRQELVRADQALLDSLTVDWDELAAAPVLLDPELSITAHLATGSLTLHARAHVAREPVCLVVRSEEDAGTADGAGAAISALFEGDRQKAAWAWAAIWPRAKAGEQAEGAVLPKTRAERGNASERLSQLAQQAAQRARSKKEASKSAAKSDAKTQPVQVRKLKDPASLRPSAGVLVNKGASATGNPVINKRRAKQQQRNFRTGHGGDGNQGSPRTVLPPSSDREKVAMEAVRSALALDVEQFNDLRAERGLGVDAIDELRQCYEIKMCSGAALPTDVTLTASEIEAARDDPDFFLAIVTGLEEGAGKLRVRFIFDPLSQLNVRVRSDLTLTGVDKAEALEFEFDVAGEPD
ncbi:sacsin N-terminal ATP-binding-like domain-containing protein [Allosphingosinicella vermicomposti]|uniref:sacsin N-terminal ATP-binding-like domain-containing protein n=1 Tax=Allosphingosinicella vermicomposti TaxID=614671 RepID=UPI000D112EC5|nr:hypothetical protein [Allosphingosinicella vermicomposti]